MMKRVTDEKQSLGDITRLDTTCAGLSFPTSVSFSQDGIMYVAEAGLPFGGAPPGGRVWRVAADGEKSLLLEGLAPPVNGLTWHEGELYISEGGRGRISALRNDGTLRTVLDGLPGPGNYHTNMVAFGPDGKLYFSQGAMTNTAIAGLDSYEIGWLGRLPHAHDIPGYDITLRGVNVETPDPLTRSPGAVARTGAFAPFGTATAAGESLQGRVPCTSAIMRCERDGSGLVLVAWGLRNAFGLGFLADGRLLAVDQGADDRGSRPVGEAPDVIFEVREGAWYGWPDFVAGEPITADTYHPQRGASPQFVLDNHDELPPPERPLVRFAPHAAAVKFDVARGSGRPGSRQLFVALFGDEAPMTAPPGPTVGRGVARIDTGDWSVHPFISGPPLVRPIDVKFHPTRSELYIVDFGDFEMDEVSGVVATAETGKVLRYRW